MPTPLSIMKDEKVEKVHLPNWLKAALIFSNFHAWTTYYPTYIEDVGCSEFAVQILFTCASVPTAIYLVTSSLAAFAAQPVVITTTVANPSAFEISALFDQQAMKDNSVVSLVCPCTVESAPLASISVWNLTEDSFCAEVRRLTQISIGKPEPDIDAIINLLKNQDNEYCIGNSEDPHDVNYVEFFNKIREIVITGDLLPLQSMSVDDFERELRNLVNLWQSALCGLAFGTKASGSFFPRFSEAVKATHPIAPDISYFDNGCFTEESLEEYRLSSYGFTYSSTPSNVIQLQQTRGQVLFAAAIDTCTAIATLRLGFLRSVKNVPLVTPVALTTEQLRLEVERLWYASRAAAGEITSQYVPGTSPDVSSTLMGSSSPLTPSGGNFYIRAPNTIPLDTYPFSSRLPFARLDSFTPSNYYYITSNALLDSVLAPLLAGEARLRADTSVVSGFPYLPASGTPGFNFTLGSFNSWVPIGNDYLTVLDACASGIPLSIDVHNVRPITTISNFSVLSSTPNLRINRSALCSTGFPGETGKVMFNIPLRCPPLVTLMGQLRASSYLASKSSPLRFTLGEYAEAFPNGEENFSSTNLNNLQTELFTAYVNGDTVERAAILNSLMISNVSFFHSSLSHWTACAPSSCTYQTVVDPSLNDVLLQAVSVYGGTATTVVTGLSMLSLLLSLLRQECPCCKKKITRSTEAKRKEEENRVDMINILGSSGKNGVTANVTT